MYVCLSICLSVCLSVCLPACLSVCLHVCLLHFATLSKFLPNYLICQQTGSFALTSLWGSGSECLMPYIRWPPESRSVSLKSLRQEINKWLNSTWLRRHSLLFLCDRSRNYGHNPGSLWIMTVSERPMTVSWWAETVCLPFRSIYERLMIEFCPVSLS